MVGALPPGRDRQALVEEVARVLAPLDPGVPIVVGASGGPDSGALLGLVAEARPDLVLHVVHVRHGLRSDDGDDAEAARSHARRVGADVAVCSVEVAAAGEGLEAAARDARHSALQAEATASGAVAVLLGHTADDQAETVLLRQARGTGTAGLAGMAPWRDHAGGVPVVRPLLRLRRGDVRGFADEEGLGGVDDPANRDERFARTVVRHEVLPALARHAGDPVAALTRLADLAREDSALLDHLAAEVSDRHLVRFGPVACLPEAAVHGRPAAIARRVVRALVATVVGGPAIDAATVDAVLALVPGRMHEAGGLSVSRGGGWLAATTTTPTPATEAFELALVDGRFAFGPGLDVVVRLARDEAVRADGQQTLDVGVPPPPAPPPGRVVPPGGVEERATVLLPDAQGGLPDGVVVRSRREGDRIRTAGGTRSVQDLLVDQHVPRLVREHIPVLAVGARVLWLAGIDADVDIVRAGQNRPAVAVSLCVPRVPET